MLLQVVSSVGGITIYQLTIFWEYQLNEWKYNSYQVLIEESLSFIHLVLQFMLNQPLPTKVSLIAPDPLVIVAHTQSPVDSRPLVGCRQ